MDTNSADKQPINIKIQVGSEDVSVNGQKPDVKPTDIKPVEEKQEGVDLKTLIPEGDYRNSSLFHEVADYFRLDPKQYEDVKYKLAYVIEWAILKLKSNKIQDVLGLLSETEHQIPQPHFGVGEKRYTNFYKFLRLSEGRAKTRAMWEEYEKEFKGLNG